MLETLAPFGSTVASGAVDASIADAVVPSAAAASVVVAPWLSCPADSAAHYTTKRMKTPGVMVPWGYGSLGLCAAAVVSSWSSWQHGT